MSNPQQPELRRSDKGAGTPQDSQSRKAAQAANEGGHAHGTDRGDKGGGRGGGTPPEQKPDHPA
ncbi:hypothetical protein ACIQJT_05225 [Streptomyces sp. NPDC091972]|uniref:hypothetical protein n=1 Tax=Streptomyces sp. NPDC091972 TaxID=3366007 RepID=UPI00380BC1FA